MGRVSLTESYDDRSVISKLNEMDKRVKENTTVVTAAEASAQASAAAAQETADRFAGSVGAVVQNANAQINASKAQVDQAKAEVDEAVTTVAGYNARLTTAEGDIDALQGVQGDYVKKAGSPQTVTSQIMVPTTATGVRDTQIANGTRIQNDLDNYAPMARLSDYQIFDGIKIFDGIPGASNTRNSSIDVANPPSNETIVGQWVALDKNNQEIAKMLGVITPTGSAYVNILVRNSDGTFKAVRLATGD